MPLLALARDGHAKKNRHHIFLRKMKREAPVRGLGRRPGRSRRRGQNWDLLGFWTARRPLRRGGKAIDRQVERGSLRICPIILFGKNVFRARLGLWTLGGEPIVCDMPSSPFSHRSSQGLLSRGAECLGREGRKVASFALNGLSFPTWGKLRLFPSLEKAAAVAGGPTTVFSFSHTHILLVCCWNTKSQ